ncbi:MAG: hypothetical protein HXY51_02470 [Nitrospirae bacterium]|nr:hypothetical protein [Nitrospirota bacterium]
MEKLSKKGVFKVRLSLLKLAFTAGMLLGASIAVAPATAMTIQYSFTGTVNQVTPRLSSTFSTSPSSSAMSGVMTVNTTDTNTLNGNIGTYSITTFSLNIGSYTATMGTSGTVEIRNGPPGNDRFNVTMNAPNGPMVSSLAPRLFDIQLRGPNSIFTSDALPASSPSITAFTNRNLWRLVFGAGNNRTVSGVITAMTAVAVVPLPPAVILFGAALVALVGLGAGNWKLRKASLPRHQGNGNNEGASSPHLRTSGPVAASFARNEVRST